MFLDIQPFLQQYSPMDIYAILFLNWSGSKHHLRDIGPNYIW